MSVEIRSISSFNQFLARSPVYYGWVVVAIVFVTMGIGVNARTAFSLLYPAIINEFQWDRATTAATFTVGFVFAGAISPLLGRLMDKFDSRYLISLSAVCVSLGMVLSTYAYAAWHIYLTLGLLVIGAGVMMTYVGHAMFLPTWFEKHRGLAVGLAFSGVGVGSIVLMPVIQGMILQEGWRYACWFIAIIILLIVLPLNLVFQRKSPAALGLLPDGASVSTDASQPVSSAYDTVVDENWAATDWSLRKAAKTAEFWWISLAASCALYVWYAVQVHQTKYLIEIGISEIEASFALGFVGFAGVAGQIYLGHLSDRIGREWVWTIAVAGFAACYGFLLLLESWQHSFLLYAMVVAQGGLGYAMAAVFGAMPADLFQGRKYGEIFGVFSMLSLIGGGIGPWLTGYLYDVTGSYQTGFLLAIGLSILSGIAVWLAAPRKKRLVAGQAEKRRLQLKK
ncbi:MFS transporter [Sneathiella glossodoripedis]|uniref:MFS transporter n=1 Tax=Sneathiella glossodoripedis TaxID=418853 RepID=UPI00046FFC12|nr:MFS transporter [Sneathiella glossodoripedis]